MSKRIIAANVEVCMTIDANGTVHKGEKKLELDALKRSWAGAIEAAMKTHGLGGMDVHVDPETVQIFEVRK